MTRRWRDGAEDHRHFNTTVNVGHVREVRPAAGMMRVEPLNSTTAHDAPIPQLGLTLDGAQSSWVRYMPGVGAQVQTSQNLQGRWEGLGYTHWSPTPRSNFSDLYGNASAQAERGAEGLRPFRTLRSGEYDMRSAGGAYIRGDRLGTLSLEGQATSIRLNGSKDEIQAEAELTRIEANGGSSMRLGVVKRVDPTAPFTETEVLTPGGGSLTTVTGANTIREWSVNVGASSPVFSFSLYDRKAGDVRDALGAPVLDFRTGGFVRDEESHYLNDGVLTSLSRRVDNLGRVTWTQNAAAGVANPAIPGVAATIQGLSLTSTLGNVAVILPGAGTGSQLIQLGSLAAFEPAVMGATWTAARSTLNSQMATFLVALGASLKAIGGSLGTLLQASGAAGAAAGAVAADVLVGQIATFEAASASYLSRTVLLT